MIWIHGDYDELEAELDRLGNEPTLVTRANLDAVLAVGTALAKASTHVLSGALKASIGSDSDYVVATKTWKGDIYWGGPLPGPSEPVDYAYYERRRGGDHDFVDVLKVLDRRWIAAIKKGLTP